MKTRNLTLDLAKGIGILLVIIGHCPMFIDYRLDIYSFHMPLFFIISGYFFSAKPFTTFTKGNLLKILLPYLITSVLIGLFLYLTGRRSLPGVLLDILYAHGGPKVTRFLPTYTYIGATWFLMALFWCRIYFYGLHRLLPRAEWLTLACVALSYGCVQLGRYYLNLPLGLLTGGSALAFYAFGYCLRNHRLPNTIVYPLIILWMCSLHYKFYSVDMVNFIYHFFPLNLLTALGGTLLVIKASEMLAAAHLHPLNAGLSFLGRHTLLLYCIHSICIKVLSYYPLGNVANLAVNLGVPLLFLLAVIAVKRLPSETKATNPS